MCFIQDSISTILIDNFNYFYTVSIPWMNRHANVFYQHLVFIAKIVPFLSEYLLIRKNLGRNTGTALKITVVKAFVTAEKPCQTVTMITTTKI